MKRLPATPLQQLQRIGIGCVIAVATATVLKLTYLVWFVL